MAESLGSIFWPLTALIVFQQVYFMRQIQKLVDKLMSRDFQEYQTAVTPKKERPKVSEPQPLPEDLRVLQGFHI